MAKSCSAHNVSSLLEIKDHLSTIFTAEISVMFPACADMPCILCHFDPSAVGNLVFGATARVGDKELFS